MAQEKQNEEKKAKTEGVNVEELPTVSLKTHEMLNQHLYGSLKILKDGYSEVELNTTDEMAVDELGLVHAGAIYSAANYAAVSAVNERNAVLVGDTSQYLAPVKVGDLVEFSAKVRQKEGRKRNVRVIGKTRDIKIFEGEFKTVVTERHALRLKLIGSEDDG